MPRKLWEEVLDKLTERIAKGVYLPGMELPALYEIGQEFKVSIGTVRRAIEELKKRNVVNNPPGKGIYITAHTPESALFHFFKFRDTNGKQVKPNLIAHNIKVRRATEREQTQLHGAPDKVFEIERIRTCNSKTCGYESSVVSCDIFPDLNRRKIPNMLYAMFQSDYYVVIVSAEESLTSEPLRKTIAAKLELEPAIPALIINRKAIDLLGRVVELRTSQYVTDSVYYSISLN